MKRSSKIVGIIPARYGSTRLPAKLLIPVLGKTVLQRTYENTLKCDVLDQVIIATDDQRIYDHASAFGCKVVMTPLDCPTGTDRLAYVLKAYPSLLDSEVIINIQGDEPCMDPSIINKVAIGLQESSKASMSTAIHHLDPEEAHRTSCVKCVIDKQGYALYFSRSLLPHGRTGQCQEGVTYYKHVGIYGYRPDFLLRYVTLPATPLQIAEDLEQLKVLEHGYSIKTVLVSQPSIGVDTQEDIIKLEKLLLCKQNSSLLPAESVLL